MLLSSQYLVQTVWFQLREWRKNGLEVLKLNISKGPVSRPPLSGSDCLNLVLDFGTTLECMSFFLGFSVGNFWNECRFLLDSVSEIFGQAAFFYVISTSDKELLLSLSIVAVKNVISLLSASGLTR